MNNLILNIFNIDIDDVDKFTSHNDNGKLIIHIRLKKAIKYCPRCGRPLISNGFKSKTINHSALIHAQLTLIYEARRYRCPSCNHSEFERNPFAFPGFRNSILVLDQVMRDLHNPHHNYTMIASRHHVSTTQIQNYFDSFVVIPHIRLPKNLGIDELHSNMAKRKNASYLGILTDNDTFSLIEVPPSRNKADLNRFFERCPKEERDAVQYVTIDMWEPYEEMAHKWLKNAIVAVDPFHVVEHLNKDFNQLRIRTMNHYIPGSNAHYLLKKWNKLLMSDDFELDNEPRYNNVFKVKLNYRDLRDMILSCSSELALAYELKERYRSFNSSCTYERAEDELDILIADFQKADIKEYEEFVGILIRWRKEIINSFIQSETTGQRLSNSKSEAMNNLIRKNINISNGLSNFPRFRKRMLYCFNDKLYYSLTASLTSLKKKNK